MLFNSQLTRLERLGRRLSVNMSTYNNTTTTAVMNDAQDPLGLIGTVVDQRVQLTIRKMVGSGTYASVYLATDQFGRRWAVKCMPRSNRPSDKHKRNTPPS